MEGQAVDAFVTPVEGDSVWWVTDRKGRSLGAIREVPGSASVSIVARPESPLWPIQEGHTSLDAALRAIAEHLGVSCQINPLCEAGDQVLPDTE